MKIFNYLYCIFTIYIYLHLSVHTKCIHKYADKPDKPVLESGALGAYINAARDASES